MIRNAWTTVVVSAIGLLLVGLSVSGVVTLVTYAIYYPVIGQGFAWARVLFSLGSLAEFALGLYLLFGGRAVVRRWLRSLDRCPACGYDTAPDADRCPECGYRTRDTSATTSTAAPPPPGTLRP